MTEERDEEWFKTPAGRGRAVRDIRVRPPKKRQSGGSGPGHRLAAARGRPEAVVKIISFGSTQANAMGMVDYVTRKGELTFETRDGEKIEGRDDEDGTKEKVAEWAERFQDRANARNVAHLMVSAPAGTDPAAVERAARAFGHQALAPDYDYGFALHTDEEHPHVHFIVARDADDGPYLGWNKAEIQAMREDFAEACKEQGIEMTATPRAIRGQGEKAERMAPRKIREREGFSLSDERAATEVLSEVTNPQASADRPWERAMVDRAAVERAHYEALARSFDELAELVRGERAMKAAALVRRQAMALRQAQTRRDRMRRLAETERLFKERDRAAAARKLATLYRQDREARREKARQVAPATPTAMRQALEGYRAEVGDQLDKDAENGSAAAQALRERLDQALHREREAEADRDGRENE